jgi:hypothetical protein
MSCEHCQELAAELRMRRPDDAQVVAKGWGKLTDAQVKEIGKMAKELGYSEY